MDLFKEALANWAKIWLADDSVAADATCARLMGFNPLRVRLSLRGPFLRQPSRGPYQDVGGTSRSTGRVRFPCCQNSAISLRRRARGRTAGESLVRPTASVKQRDEEKWFLGKIVQCIPRARSLASRAAVPAGRMRKTGSPKKECSASREPDLLAPWAGLAGRNEEKWFRRERVRRLSGGPDLLVSWTRV